MWVYYFDHYGAYVPPTNKSIYDIDVVYRPSDCVWMVPGTWDTD